MSDMEEGSKVCHICGEDKKLSCYGNNKRKKDGLDYRCKPCVAKYVKNLRKGILMNNPKLHGMKPKPRRKVKKKTKKERGVPRKKDNLITRRKKSTAARSRWRAHRIREEKNNLFPSRVYAKYIPTPKYETVEYDFLQYHNLIFRWAKKYSGLETRALEMLLYINPMPAFSRKQFYMYHRSLGMYSQINFKLLLDNGWIRVFRNKTAQERELFIASRKCRAFISKMHRISCGESDINTQPLEKKVETKSQGYFLDAIKKMNQKNKELRDAGL